MWRKRKRKEEEEEEEAGSGEKGRLEDRPVCCSSGSGVCDASRVYRTAQEHSLAGARLHPCPLLTGHTT